MKKFVKIFTLAVLLCARGAEASSSPETTMRNLTLAGMGLYLGASCYRGYLKKSVNKQAAQQKVVSVNEQAAQKKVVVEPESSSLQEVVNAQIERIVSQKCQEKINIDPPTYSNLQHSLVAVYRACGSKVIPNDVYGNFRTDEQLAVRQLFLSENMRNHIVTVRSTKISDLFKSFFDKRFSKMQAIYNSDIQPPKIRSEETSARARLEQIFPQAETPVITAGLKYKIELLTKLRDDYDRFLTSYSQYRDRFNAWPDSSAKKWYILCDCENMGIRPCPYPENRIAEFDGN